MYRFYPKGHLAASRNHGSRSVSFSFRLPFVQPVEIRMSEIRVCLPLDLVRSGIVHKAFEFHVEVGGEVPFKSFLNFRRIRMPTVMAPKAKAITITVRFNFDGDLDEMSHERLAEGSKTTTSWRAMGSPTFGCPPSINIMVGRSRVNGPIFKAPFRRARNRGCRPATEPTSPTFLGVSSNDNWFVKDNGKRSAALFPVSSSAAICRSPKSTITEGNASSPFPI